MKKGVLILLGMFLMVSTVEAKNGKLPSKIGVKYSYDNAVSFIERGIKFHVFLNGDFDFNSTIRNNYYNDYGRRTKRSRVSIERDYDGKIRRVGTVFINYDYRGNVKRIGNVFMKYRRGNLTKIGGLNISYNRWGNPRFFGQVKGNEFYSNNSDFNFNRNFGDVCEYDDVYFYRSDFRNKYSQIREDNNFYYYRAKPNAKIGKRSKILKRRKPATRKFTKKRMARKAPNSYRKSTMNKESSRRKKQKRSRNLKNRTQQKREQAIIIRR